MHDLTELGTSVPAFLAKLWKLVDDPETDDLICWSDSGQSFVIVNTVRFTQELLPMYYKHNNMASFIRQLNMYGFHKVVSIDSGGLKSDRDCMEFTHTCFVKGRPYLMENIKRKMSTSRNAPTLAYVKEMTKDVKGLAQTEILAQVLTDVNNLKSKQASWDSKLAAMKRENEALWRELAIFRQKHHKQAQIINKLIQFIVTMVRPSGRNVPLRRRYPLMINDTEENKVHVAGSLSGPTIRELDPVELLLGQSETSVATPAPSGGQSSKQSGEAEREYIIPHLVEDLPPEEDEYVTTSLIDSNTPYVVVSPVEVETEPELSPWLDMGSPDVESEAAMTPINPIHVNPIVAAAETPALKYPVIKAREIKPATGQKKGFKAVGKAQSHEIPPQPQPHRRVMQIAPQPLTQLTSKPKRVIQIAAQPQPQPQLASKPRRVIQIAPQPSSKNKKRGTTAKKPRKNILPRKKPRCEPSVKVEPVVELEEGKDLLAEAFHLIQDEDLQPTHLATPDEANTSGDKSDNNVPILEILEKAVAQSGLPALESSSSPELPELTQSSPKPVQAMQLNQGAPQPSAQPDVLDSEVILDPKSLVLVRPNSSFNAEEVARYVQTMDLGSHVDMVQGDIDILKDFLKSDGYSLDANTLLELFNEDPMSLIMPPPSDNKDSKEGNELMTYSSPNLMDLMEMYGGSSSLLAGSCPPSPTPSVLETPIMTPASPTFPPPTKRRRK